MTQLKERAGIQNETTTLPMKKKISDFRRKREMPPQTKSQRGGVCKVGPLDELGQDSEAVISIIHLLRKRRYLQLFLRFISISALLQGVSNCVQYTSFSSNDTVNVVAINRATHSGASVSLFQGIVLIALSMVTAVVGNFIPQMIVELAQANGVNYETIEEFHGRVKVDQVLSSSSWRITGLDVDTGATDSGHSASGEEIFSRMEPCSNSSKESGVCAEQKSDKSGTPNMISSKKLFPALPIFFRKSFAKIQTLNLFCVSLTLLFLILSVQLFEPNGEHEMNRKLIRGEQLSLYVVGTLFGAFLALRIPAWTRVATVFLLLCAGVAHIVLTSEHHSPSAPRDALRDVALYAAAYAGLVAIVHESHRQEEAAVERLVAARARSGKPCPKPPLGLPAAFKEAVADAPRERSATLQLDNAIQNLIERKSSLSSSTCMELARVLRSMSEAERLDLRHQVMRQRSWLSGMTIARRRLPSTESAKTLRPEHAHLLGVYVRPKPCTPSLKGMKRYSRVARPSLEARVPARSQALVRQMREWDFGEGGVFRRISEAKRGGGAHGFAQNPLAVLVLNACDDLGCFSGLGLSDAFTYNFMEQVERRYLPAAQVAYHNAVHATDVTQSVYVLLRTRLSKWSLLQRYAAVVAAACHDVGHPGMNNSFQIRTSSKLAIRYNDASVLENFHVATTFEILRGLGDTSPLTVLDEANQLAFRAQVVEMILATDLASHFQHLRTLEEYFKNDSVTRMEDPRVNGQKNGRACSGEFHLCSMLLHFADVGSVSKKWGIYEQWIEMLFAEFHEQGDKERELGLEVAEFMDRRSADSSPPAAQVSFIEVVVAPLHSCLRPYAPVLFDRLGETIQQNTNELKTWKLRLHKPGDETEEDEEVRPFEDDAV